ncbi:DNA replication and repair protein RecF [candidate division WWE3 bacterium]|nr:DNA replication and repair protein RecF [candidate division WWE3 bacterium]
MYLKHLQLTNYRNHEDKKLVFDAAGKLIVGPNGSGKTNIIEAINFLATGKPFRAGYDREVIMHGKSLAAIKAQVIEGISQEEKEARAIPEDQETPAGHQETPQKNENKPITIGIGIQKSDKYENASSKKVKINGKSTKIGSLAEKVNTVLFSPLDMNLLTNSPSTRRNFFDDVLEQASKEYKKARRDFRKARRQKNKILEIIRETGKGHSQLDYWNKKVLEMGQVIQENRKKLAEYFNDQMDSHLETLDPSLECTFVYDANLINQERLEIYAEKELAAGTSLIGPHRDDFYLEQEKISNLADYASRGQQRTLILTLKLCVLEFLEGVVGKKPILLLDDIFSELDETHRGVLENLVRSQQTILTATEVPKGFESFPIEELK